MTKSPQPRPGILEIHAYQPGESKIPGKTEVIKLASNESPFGPSSRAVEAARAPLDHMQLYPDGGSVALREAIGAAHGMNPDQIVCGSGSEQILSLSAGIYAGPGDEIIQSEFGFLAYGIVARAFGATLISAKEQDYKTDVDAVLDCVTERTRIVFIANPNNPTGTMIPASEMHRLREGLRDDVLLVIDAAYAEYVEHESYTPGHELVTESIANGTQNTLVTHTFSKLYGMAAMRVGWCYAPPAVADAMNRVRSVFNVTSVGQAAAIAALGDSDHIVMSRAHNKAWLPRLSAGFKSMGLKVPESYGNFLLVEFPGGADQAAATDRHLRDDAIIVRPVGVYGLAHCLRITIGTDAQNEAVIDSLGRFMAV